MGLKHKMTKAYIITNGEYEDYHICGVFLDENRAKEVVNNFGGEIETWNVDGINELSPFNLYKIEMEKDGNVLLSRPVKEWDERHLESNGPIINDFTRTMSIVVRAIDKEAAIRKANEARTQLIAENEWI